MRPFLPAMMLFLCCCNLSVAQAPKTPPPSEEQRREVLGLLREIYRSEYVAARTANQKSELAAKILATATETKESAQRYAMLKLAADIAVQAGDAELVSGIVNRMAEQYQIDEIAMRLGALKETTKHISSATEPAARDAVVEFCTRMMDQNDFENALSLLSASASHFREPTSRRVIGRLADRARLLQNQFGRVSGHLKTLQANPDDPEANLMVGKFRCFDRGEWIEGLNNLARGSNAQLKAIATLELSDQSNSARDMRIADGWWEYSSTADEKEATPAKLRAGAYYRRAAASLQGLQQAKATARSQDAQTLGDFPVLAKTDKKGRPDAPEPARPNPMRERKVVYDLPSGFRDVVVGGSGRYLIFHLDQLNKLAFFDVFERKVTEYVDTETSDIRFTAGAEEFFIAKRPQNVVERWSLETFKKLSVVKLPLEHPVQSIVMGSASYGPIYAGAEAGPGIFLTTRTLRPASYEVVDHQYQRTGELQGSGPESRVRASANGRAFAMWRTNVSPGGFRTYVIAGRLVHTFYDHDTMGYIEPSPDGELMYTSRGVFTSQTKKFLDNDGNFATSFRVPAVTGDYAVGIPRDDKGKKKSNPVHILVSGQSDPILTLPNISIRAGEYGDFHGREILTLARRVYLLPQADLLLTLPESNKSLVLHHVNLEQELENSGVDYLYVASRPPRVVPVGGGYKYQIVAKSKSGEVDFELISGPNGMRVSDQGLVTWRAPRRGGTAEHEVIVSIRDKSGQQRTHTFQLSVVDSR